MPAPFSTEACLLARSLSPSFSASSTYSAVAPGAHLAIRIAAVVDVVANVVPYCRIHDRRAPLWRLARPEVVFQAPKVRAQPHILILPKPQHAVSDTVARAERLRPKQNDAMLNSRP